MANICNNRAMAAFTHPGRHRVAVLVRHGVKPLELGIVHELFGTAASAAGEPLYEVITCTPTPGGEVRTDADFPITVRHGPQALAGADTVIIPATQEPDESETCGYLPAALAAAFACIRPGTRIASICTGAFVLAAAGLLDGRRATTHWMSAGQFRRLYPAVELDPDVLYTHEGNILTSAGEAAGIDLCLHMIRCDHGAAVANTVARRAVVPPHRDGGQAQFIQRPVPQEHDASTAPARTWALGHLDQPLSLRDLATRASMSLRTFTRRFRDETGISPAQWLTQQRIERARQLLENTDLPIDRVAAEAGFGTAASLRQQLHTTVGVSPRSYRVTFRGPAASEHPVSLFRRIRSLPAARQLRTHGLRAAGRRPARTGPRCGPRPARPRLQRPPRRGQPPRLRRRRRRVQAVGSAYRANETKTETAACIRAELRRGGPSVLPAQRWRRMRDSNSRGVAPNTLSKSAPARSCPAGNVRELVPAAIVGHPRTQPTVAG